MKSRIIGSLVLVSVLAGSTVAAETLDQIKDRIVAAAKKTQSLSAKTKTVTSMKQEGFSMMSTAEGTMELVNKGDVQLMRMENKTVMKSTMGGHTTSQESSMLTISDGDHTYTLSEMAGMKTAQKTKNANSPDDPFKAWRDNATLKVLPDASVDGRAVWVIEIVPNAPQNMQGKVVASFDKQTGQLIMMEGFSPEGKPMTKMTLSDIKINPKISTDRFVFKAPAGVTVQDMTN